jgi:hypothetical protein
MTRYTRSQVNLTWNNTTRYHFIFSSLVFVLFCFFMHHGIMDYIFVMACCDKFTRHEKKLKFCWKICFTPFKHDIHVCVFTVMYMFVNCICTKYIKTCIHQGLNPRSWYHTKVLTTEPLQHFMKKNEKN